MAGTYGFILNEAIFYYKDYTINIFSKESITIEQLDKPLPFLYSSEQIINIEEKKKITN